MDASFFDDTQGSTSWSWQLESFFAPSHTTNPTWTYHNPGTHNVRLTASVGAVECVPDQVTITVAPTASPDPDASPDPTRVPRRARTPPKSLCKVPKLIGKQHTMAQSLWAAKGFFNPVTLVPGASETDRWDIQYQSIAADADASCQSIIQIGPDPLGDP